MRRRRPSDETLVTLRGKLEDLAPRSADRQHLLQECAGLHGVSVATVYRALREQFRPRSLHRRGPWRHAEAAEFATLPDFLPHRDDRVSVVHILHSARDYEALLFPEG